MMLERLHVCVLPVILVVFYYVVPLGSPVLSDGYVSTCPIPSEVKERSLHHPCPEKKQYHIVWDPQRNKYKYGCFESRMVPRGNVTTLDISGNINTEDCHEGTFQPLPYRSNTQCACKETKGHCNKTGQVVASNGSITEDRTCRCDFRRGYKFSIKPSNGCFCQSSSEDCACIKEECKTGYRLSPDYECVHENLYSTTNYTCEDITSEESTTESVPDNDTSIPETIPTVKLTKSVIAIIVLVVVIVILCSCAAGVLLEKKCGVYARMPACCKNCIPGRNGSAPTNNEGKQNVPVQVRGTSKGKDSHPVQETGSDRANEKLIKVDKWKNEVTYKRSTEDTVLDYTVE